MDKWLDELETCLRQMHEEHHQMLALIQRKQQAMRQAKADAVHECCGLENQCIQRIGEVEKKRQACLGRLTAAWAPNSAKPLTIVEIAERVAEPRRGRLLVLKAQLTELMHGVRRENQVAQIATQGLIQHVQGVIKQVAAAMNPGTYGRRGPVVSSNMPCSSFSVTG
jgi:hypothetical protein